jgi:methionyl-tRNA formyltransferase
VKKIVVFCDIKDIFFQKYIPILKKKIQKSYKFYFFKNYDYQKINCDVAFYISCRKKILNKHIKKNKINVVVHPSKLPTGKGSGIVSWSILEKKKKIWISFFKPDLKKFDSGCIYLQDYFLLKGTELCDEIRRKQALKTIEMVQEFIDNAKAHKIKCKPQKNNYRSKFYPIRKPEDSEIKINKNILQQINLLRICDNKRYPAFFYYSGKKYKIKIYDFK